MTVYFRWNEKNEPLYLMGYDEESYLRMKRVILPQINVAMSRMMGLPKRSIKVRRISCFTAVYVSKSDWDKRRQDITTLNTHRDYANFLYGLLSPFNWRNIKANAKN